MCGLEREKIGQWILLLVAVISEVGDLISDWKFYIEMSKQERGIVFGPIDKNLLCAILVFCCVGIVTCLAEIVDEFYEIISSKKACINVIYLSAIVLWIEELPQISISAAIASCRDEGPSLTQLVKASFLIVGCIARIIIAIKNICSTKDSDDDNLCIFSSFALIFGSILAFFLALVIFTLKNVQHDNKNFKFKASTELETRGVDPSRYFENAGIYINGMDIKVKYTNSNLDNTWLKMVHTECYNETKHYMFSQVDETKPLLFSQVNESECLDLINTADVEEIWIHFRFLPQTCYRPIGDVQYNVCHVTYEDCSEHLNHCAELNLKYFTIESGENYQYHLKPTNDTSLFEFFGSDNLTPTKEAWKTGFFRCENSGFEAPNLNKSIEVKCLS
ncbi:Hypothetical predicted protein [Mytilus galloprovincialis]|uniref:Uncharacterized protein n=1 Tax=Mytilus galloprovincialis TaxID=29158 RepID=A0A8B6EP79_MYTGA|nr:Hypothetical predicted protein [Mytilus galloprovincialis]